MGKKIVEKRGEFIKHFLMAESPCAAETEQEDIRGGEGGEEGDSPSDRTDFMMKKKKERKRGGIKTYRKSVVKKRKKMKFQQESKGKSRVHVIRSRKCSNCGNERTPVH